MTPYQRLELRRKQRDADICDDVANLRREYGVLWCLAMGIVMIPMMVLILVAVITAVVLGIEPVGDVLAQEE